MSSQHTRRLRRPLRAGTLVIAVAAILLGLSGTPAQAYANAFYPTQNANNRGVDVLAIQYLLQHHGQTLSADGGFHSQTTAAVRSFQSAKGLTVDGVVGTNTWNALVVPLQQGATGPAVRALQVQLNAKRGSNLTVDGDFGAATNSAVRSFQSHAGIEVDGAVGPTTWRNLLWHYDLVDFSANNLCDQNPAGNTSANWLTGAAAGQLEYAARSFASTGQGRVPMGDAGFEHGGDIYDHATHEDGLDVDVWPIRTDSAQCTAGRITWQSGTYDRAATRQLAQAIRNAAPGHIKYIFFNDPVLISEGLVTHEPNHDNHLHVRYCEKYNPDSKYDC